MNSAVSSDQTFYTIKSSWTSGGNQDLSTVMKQRLAHEQTIAEIGEMLEDARVSERDLTGARVGEDLRTLRSERDDALSRIRMLEGDLIDVRTKHREDRTATDTRNDRALAQILARLKDQLAKEGESNRVYAQSRLERLEEDNKALVEGRGTVAAMEAAKATAVRAAEQEGAWDVERLRESLEAIYELRVKELRAMKLSSDDSHAEELKRSLEAAESRRKKDLEGVEGIARRDRERATKVEAGMANELDALLTRLKVLADDPERNGQVPMELRARIASLEDKVLGAQKSLASSEEQLTTAKRRGLVLEEAQASAQRSLADLRSTSTVIEGWARDLADWLDALTESSAVVQPGLPPLHPAYPNLAPLCRALDRHVTQYRHTIDVAQHAASGSAFASPYPLAKLHQQLRKMHLDMEQSLRNRQESEAAVAKERAIAEVAREAAEAASTTLIEQKEQMDKLRQVIDERSKAVDTKESYELRLLKREMQAEADKHRADGDRILAGERECAEVSFELSVLQDQLAVCHSEIARLEKERASLEAARGSAGLQLDSAVDARNDAQAAVREALHANKQLQRIALQAQRALDSMTVRFNDADRERKQYEAVSIRLRTAEKVTRKQKECILVLEVRRSDVEADLERERCALAIATTAVENKDAEIKRLCAECKIVGDELRDQRKDQDAAYDKIEAVFRAVTRSVSCTDRKQGATSVERDVEAAVQALVDSQALLLERISLLEKERDRAVNDLNRRDDREEILGKDVAAERVTVKELRARLKDVAGSIKALEPYKQLVEQAREDDKGPVGHARVSFARLCRALNELALAKDEVEKLRAGTAIASDGAVDKVNHFVSRMATVSIEGDPDFVPWRGVSLTAAEWQAVAAQHTRPTLLKDLVARTEALARWLEMALDCPNEAPMSNAGVTELVQQTEQSAWSLMEAWERVIKVVMSGDREVETQHLEKVAKLGYVLVTAHRTVSRSRRTLQRKAEQEGAEAARHNVILARQLKDLQDKAAGSPGDVLMM